MTLRRIRLPRQLRINELKKQAEAINTEINEYNTKLNALMRKLRL